MKSLWSFEPFHQETNSIKAMYKSLATISGNPAKIEVGFVVTRTESELNLAFDIPESERFSSYPKNQMKQKLKEAQVKIDDKKIHVIDHPTFSTTKSVDRLLKLASERDVDLIGIYTHARKGFSRLVIGSFAETLIHRSSKDLLILSPKATVTTPMKHVLFATDFGPNSKKEFSKLFSYLKNFNPVLTVFHDAEIIYKKSLDEKNPKIHAYRKKVDEMKLWIEDQCHKAGIKGTVVIASDFKSTSDHVLSIAKKNKIDLVVVCAKVGPTAALMGGSVTRQVIRESSAPVLVLKNGKSK
jgi:nucleotide-binding universal stress UspA family protein